MSVTNKAPSGVYCLNFARGKVELPKSDTIPNIVNSKAMNELLKDDAEPYYMVEAIEYPTNGTGGIYEKGFFKSFLANMKDRPYPGSKRGHEWQSRASSDFYTIGGMMVDNADGKSGVVYLKMYIPKEGDTTSNSGFIRDARAGMVHFSLVTSPEYKMVKGDDGKEQLHFTSSKGYERNDAVGFGEGAMSQIVNSKLAFDVEEAKGLIESGKYDNVANIDGDAIQGGKVYRSVLRRIASHADGDDKTAIAELISMIDKKTNRRKTMDKDEILAALKNMVANAQTNIVEIANAVGLGSMVKNEKDKQDSAMVLELNSILGDNPVEKAKALIAEKQANAAAAFELALSGKVGAKVSKNAKGEDVANPAYTYAAMKCAGKEGDALKNALTDLEADPVMISIRGNMADPTSSINVIESNAKQPEARKLVAVY